MSEDDRGARQAHIQKTVDDVLKDAKLPTAARHGLAFLFPKAEETLKTYIRAGATDAPHRLRQRRISVEDFAPAYFRMDPQRATWGRSEIETILGHDEPSVALGYVEERLQAALKVDRPRLRRLLLQQLEAFFSEQPITEEWLRALVDVSPGYIAVGDATAKHFFVDDNADRLRRIVYQGLKPLDAKARASLVKMVISAAVDISLLCGIVRLIAGDIRPKTVERGEKLEVTFGDETEPVRHALLARVREFAASDRIWQQVQPGSVLWFWWGAVLDDEVRKFTHSALESESGIRALLDVPVQLVRSTAGDYEHVGYGWSEIIQTERLAEIAASWLSDPSKLDNDRRLAQRYVTAFKRQERV